MKRLTTNVRPSDVREYLDVMSEIDLRIMNRLGPEYTLNVMNGLNGLVTELVQEHTLS